MDRQPVGRFGRGDQFDNNLMTDQRTTAPILRYETKQPMLDLVPFAGSRRKMTNRDRQAERVG